MRGVRSRHSAVVALLAFCATAATAAELTFLRDGKPPRTISGEALRARCRPRTVVVDPDPYYHARKRYVACPLREVLSEGFGDLPPSSADVLMHALDGYVKTTTGALLAEDGGFLAFGDADHSPNGRLGWLPIDRRKVDPGPFYVVWTGAAQRDAHRYPWPYQLASIEVTDFRARYPHTVPTGTPADAPAWVGFDVFRAECVACHAVNGEGGKVGPDLNVPQSVVEYRPIEQLKEYIRNPARFRYGNMPSHEHLDAAALDGLIAYFEAMRTRKHDPGAQP